MLLNSIDAARSDTRLASLMDALEKSAIQTSMGEASDHYYFLILHDWGTLDCAFFVMYIEKENCLKLNFTEKRDLSANLCLAINMANLEGVSDDQVIRSFHDIPKGLKAGYSFETKSLCLTQPLFYGAGGAAEHFVELLPAYIERIADMRFKIDSEKNRVDAKFA